MVEVLTAYRDYDPPVDAEGAIRRMLDLTPAEYLAGLKTVVIRNSTGLNHERRRSKTLSRKRKVAVVNCRGLYHPKWRGELAWIEIFIDNILAGWPKPLLWVPLFRDMAIGDVLFHELGHHVHYAKFPEYREREDVADQWRLRLGKQFFSRKYWYIIPILRPLVKVVKLLIPHRILQEARRR